MGSTLDLIRAEARREREEEEQKKKQSGETSASTKSRSETVKQLQKAAENWKTSPVKAEAARGTAENYSAASTKIPSVETGITTNRSPVGETFQTLSSQIQASRNATEKDEEESFWERLKSAATEATRDFFRDEDKEDEASGWEVAKNAAFSGLNKFNVGIASTLDLIAPTDFLGEYDPFSRLNDYYKGLSAHYDQELAESLEGKSKAAQTAANVGSSTVAAIPNAILALMTGGASIGAQGTAALTGAAASAGSTGLAATVGTAAKELAKNPLYWSSVAQTLGPDYDEAKENGASDLEAAASAVISSAINAGVEIGGGLETLPGLFKQGGNSAVRQWVRSMLEEGQEEVVQGVVSGITEKAVYDRDKEWYSATDEDAVFNPGRMAEEGLMGAAVGGILGGGQMGAISAVNAGINRVNNNRLGKVGADYQVAAEELVNEGLTFSPETEAYQTAQEVKARMDAGETVSDADLGRVVVANERTMQAEERLAQANMPAETRNTTEPQEIQPVIDFSQESDAQPAQREAPVREAQNAAESVPYNVMAADNEQRQQVLRAQQARESYLDRLGYGERGTETFRSIVEDSGADPDQVRVQFQSAYEAGLTNLPRERAALSTAIQEEAYNAGRQDYILNMAQPAKQTVVQKDAGFVRTRLPADVTEAQYKAVDALAKATGVKVRMAKGLKGNAEIAADGTVLIDETFQREVAGKKRSIVFYAAHEIGMHRLMQLAPKEGQAFIDAMIQSKNEGLMYGQLTDTESKQYEYGKQDVYLSTRAAMEEVAADSILDMYESEDAFIEALNRVLTGKDEKAKKGARKFKDILDDIVRKLKRAIAKLTGKERAEARETLGEVEQLRSLWEQALTAAEKSANEVGRAAEGRDTIGTKYSAKEDGSYDEAGSRETRKSFIERNERRGWKTQTYGETAVAFVPVSRADVGGIAEGIQRELSGLGIRSFFHSGLQANIDGVTRNVKGEAHTIPGHVVGINARTTQNKKEVAGHEAFHYWLESRAEFEQVLVDNIQDYAPETVMFMVETVMIYSQDGHIDNALLHEEFRARITGMLHANKRTAALRKMLRDYDAVKAAWDELVAGNAGTVIEEGPEAGTKYSLVTDQETLAFLNGQKGVKVYRAMQEIDGKLYPPMAALMKDESGKKQLVEATKKGAWYQADERPELIKTDKNGKHKFELNKGNGGMVPAAYNPYFHTSASPLNDQFSSAYNRPNIVVVEGYIPESELTSGYKARYAKDSVGETSWHAGPVASKLKGAKARRVFLSRWFKAERVVPDKEVAKIIAKTLEGEDVRVPWNVVTPSLRKALEAEGVEIDYKSVKMGSKVVPFESTQYSLKDSEGNTLTKAQQDYFKDSKVRDAKGNLLVMYQGGKGDFTVFDRKKSSYSNHYGRGFYFTNSESHAKQYGEARAFYLNIENPVSTEETTITKAQLRKFLEAVAENEDDFSFENYGYGATVESVLKSIYGKSDFSMLYDVDQTAVGNMVETVELFNRINGTDYDGLILDTETVTFRSNQAKSVDNLNPTEDEDIRFSLKSARESDKNLIAMHNLNADKLKGALELGGFPMPSIAIVKNDMGHEEFGDISVLFRKDTISPTDRRNKLYGADAWTPTRPRVGYKVSDKVRQRIENKVRKLLEGTNLMSEYRLMLDDSNMDDKMSRWDGDFKFAYGDNEALKIAFLKDKGIVFNPVMQEKQYSHYADNVVLRRIDRALGGKSREIWNQGFKEIMTHEQLIRKLMNDHMEEQGAPRIYDEPLGFNQLHPIIGAAADYARDGAKKVIDTRATRERLDKKFTKKVKAEYDAWLDELSAGIIEKKGLRNNKDWFTPSGNRRSFEQLYMEYNLANIVKAMADEDEKGGGVLGTGNIFGAATKDYGSISEMKADADRLVMEDEETHKAAHDAFSQRLVEITNKMVKPDDNGFGATLDAGDAAVESLIKGKTVSGILRQLRTWSRFNATKEIAQDIYDLAQDISEAPTAYFEAKPRRAVGFDEVAAVVMPRKGNAELKAKLEERGVKVLTYTVGKDGDRLKKINSVDNIAFSLKAHNDLLEENAKLRKVHAALAEQFAVTKFEMPDKKAMDTFAKNLLKDWKSGADINETREALTELYTFVRETVNGDDPDLNALEQRAYEVAVPILQNVVELDDTEFQEYKALREHIRKTSITLDKALEHDLEGYESLNDFRKAYFGRIRLVNGGLPVNSFYQELESMYPGIFDQEKYDDQAAQLLHIAQVLDDLKPTEVNPYSHNMRETATWLASDIIQRIYDLPQAKPTFGDKMKGKIPKSITGGLDEMGTLLNQQQTSLERADTEARRARLELDEAKRTGNTLITTNRALKRQLEDMKAENARIIEENRQKLKDTIAGQRMAAGREMAKLKNKQKEKLAQASDTKKRQVMRAKILRHTTELSKKLLRASDRNHVPQELQGAVAKLLESINLESNYTYDSQSDGYKKNDQGSPTNRTKMARQLQKLYGEMADELTIDPDLLGSDGLLAEVIGMADLRLVDMTLPELETVWKAVRAIEASVQSANIAFNQSRWDTISEAAEELRADNKGKRDKVELDGPFGSLGKIQKLTGLDMMTPEAYFHRLGKGGDGLFRMMRDAQDDHIRKMKEVSDFTHEALKGVNVRKLEDKMHTVKLGGEDVKLSTAQIMELYVLLNREQAREHIMVGGILPDVVSKGGIKKVARAKPVRNVQMSELLAAFRLLSEQEIQIAKKLQEYASTELSKWGNEAAMKVYNYEKFGEKAYWPIRVNRQETQSNVQKDTQVTSVAGRGFTKGTKPHANNSVMIGSIFDTFSTHASEMATYAAWLAPMEDINRIRNYTFKSAGNTVDTVKGIIDTVHGKGGTVYLSKLLADLSNGVKGTHGETAYMSGLVGNYKAASVGANLRVIIQQPTALLRALDMLGPQYLVAGMRPANGWKKAKKYAPIAQWKDWGYFDINTGRQMKDVLFDSDSVLNKVKNASMWGAGKADSLSWGLLWNAVETETKHKRKDLKPGTEQFYEAVAERFNEVVDHTQVVDGILQRSQIMRSADGLTKMATSFMGEPTKQYNMMMGAAYDATHGSKDQRKAGKKKFLRAAVTLTISGVANAMAQAIMDAVRDDDKEKEYWEKWLTALTGLTGEEETLGEKAKNVVLEGNLGGTFNPAGYIPYVKDILSIIQGYDVTRMDMESIEKTLSASQNMVKALRGEGKYTLGGASAALFAEVARMAGIPVANLKREVKSFAMLAALETDNYLMQYRMEKASLELNYSGNSGTFLDILFNAYQNDEEAYDIIYADMIASGYDPEKLANGMETRMKKAEGVKKVDELEQRYLHPDQQSEWDRKLSNLQDSSLWSDAEWDQRDKLEEKLYHLVTDSKTGQELQDKIDEGEIYGLSETDYLLYTLALDMYDQPNKNGEYGGTPTGEEKAEAIHALGDLSDGEIAFLWDTEQGFEAYAAGLDMQAIVDRIGGGDDVDVDKLIEMRDVGIDEQTYFDFRDMLKEVDTPTKSGKMGSYTQKEATAAIVAMPDLTREERAALWQSVNKSWKATKNPWR